MAEFLAAHSFRLLTDAPGVPFNHEAVARAAGVSARTAYRYFPTQGDLVAAVWRHLRDSTGTVWPDDVESILTDVRTLFGQFERHDTVTRAMLAASSRANYSAFGSAEGRVAFRTALADRLAHMPADSGEQLVATCLAIYSAPFWQMLRDRGQLSAAAAADAACMAMAAVLTAAADPSTSPAPTLDS